ncbi:UNVERIFIED_CONTAM: F-box protein SKIP23 [Sesamum calycinum]|uniref:F-box protein SKIP23 n=1 Tax=Sesamum calycinum TaxID=2727403 RepID=A0AAW2PK24_9LAMI
MADWSTLPAELLNLVSQQLPSSTDVLRFRSVCSTWRAAVPPPPTTASFPILLIPAFPIPAGVFTSPNAPSILQSPLTNHSSWIIKLERDNPPGCISSTRLRAPNSDPCLNFPKLFNFFNLRVKELGEEYALQYINFRPTANSIGEAGNLYMEKVAVSNNLGNGFVLLTIHVSGKLVVCKSGDKKWRVIDDLPSPYDDVILREGRFCGWGRVVLVNSLET